MGEEEPSRIAIGIAVTLLGSISFQMALLYLTNHHDRDMRRYSYGVINQTVSIFCAVLMFQTFDDIVQRLMDGTTEEFQVMVDMGHMMFWFVVLQLALAWIVGVRLGTVEEEVVVPTTVPDPDAELGRRKTTCKQTQVKRRATFKEDEDENKKKDLRCYSVLLAHLAGFASINAWGSVLQLPFFRTKATSLLVLPFSGLGQFVLQRLTDCVRERIAGSDGVKDEKEREWDEECEDAENDVMGLTWSFTAVQALRFFITDDLPDQHGKEAGDVLESHTLYQAMTLAGCGILFIPAMIGIFLNIKNQAGEDDNESDISDSDDDSEKLIEEFEKGDVVEAQRGGWWLMAQVEDPDVLGDKVLVSWADGDSRETHQEPQRIRSPVALSPGMEVQSFADGEWREAVIEEATADMAIVRYTDGWDKDKERDRSLIRLPVADEASEEEEEEEEDSLVERMMNVLTITFAMAFAWSLFYAAQMGLATNSEMRDPMVLAVNLTLFNSFWSFAAIRVLDKVDDWTRETTDLFVARNTMTKAYLVVDEDRWRVLEGGQKGSGKHRSVFVLQEKPDKDGINTQIYLLHGNRYVTNDGTLAERSSRSKAPLEKVKKSEISGRVRIGVGKYEYDLYPKGTNQSTKKVDMVLKRVIRSLGILVGFSWEQCFDEAVESLSEVMPWPHLSRFLLALFCIIIIVPAWKWYVLPMSEQNGWKFGFVVNHQDEKWNDVVTHVWKAKGLRPQLHKAVPKVLASTMMGKQTVEFGSGSLPSDLQRRGSSSSSDTNTTSQSQRVHFTSNNNNSNTRNQNSSSFNNPEQGGLRNRPIQIPQSTPDRPQETTNRSALLANYQDFDRQAEEEQRRYAADRQGGGSFGRPPFRPASNGSSWPPPQGSTLNSARGARGGLSPRSPTGTGTRKATDDLRVAAEGFMDLYAKMRDTSGEERRQLLQSYNRQMDSLLERMKELQATVRSRSPSPSPAAAASGGSPTSFGNLAVTNGGGGGVGGGGL
eukprot:CAMPEP_0206553856 /NCGR_PEP_ID=MMETSP0325_2-20121206/16857_1 /ASSEMBLY_ACC=CAM_ASM_000347 /TAXON_ID=2866 /ORGANISM="Crypthecodinium cohnii, Strain Seligo" /LENGTH=994 /DNA_ID=CAMNT_0054053865 /DNA_START=50 /DNA_END=3030 /DNA_ORIENTATION=+